MGKREKRQIRNTMSDVVVKEEENEKYEIEGYFVVFDSPTELWEGAYEEVKKEAFSEVEGADVRALIDHDTSKVLGRTKAGTLSLEVDNKGLRGIIKINEKDTEAMNMYYRVKRGDVNQCSFGFDIIEEETTYREDGSVMWIIKKLELYEVSICTFPAYSDTGVQARKKEYTQYKERKLEQAKKRLRERLSK